MMGVGTLMMVSALYGSYGWAGGLTAVNGLAWAVGNAILSRLVDRYGQSRVMIPACIVSAAGLVWLIVAALEHSPAWLLFMPAALSGLAGGSAGALVRVRWNHALGDSPLLLTAFSLESTLDEVTYIIGPVAATWLATMVHPTAGLVAPVILGLGGGMWFYYGLRRSQPPVQGRVQLLEDGTKPAPAPAPLDTTTPVVQDVQPITSPDRFVLRFSGMAQLVAVTALFGCAFGSIDVATVAATTTWDARPMAGLVLAGMSFGSAVAGLVYGARQWQSSLSRRFLIGVALFGGLMGLYQLAHNVPILFICGLLAGSAVAPSFTNANSLVSRMVPKHRLTEGLAWMGTSIGVGASLGSSVAGRLIDLAGYDAGYWTALVGGMGALFFAVIGYRTIKRQTG